MSLFAKVPRGKTDAQMEVYSVSRKVLINFDKVQMNKKHTFKSEDKALLVHTVHCFLADSSY